jgi:spermidine synthase
VVRSSSAPALPAPLRLTIILTCFFFSGATSLVLETAWSKQLSYLLGTDLYGTATTVVSYMGGLGVGAWLAARFYHRVKAPLKAYAWLQGLIALFGFASIPLLRSMHPLFEGLYGLSSTPYVFLLLRFVVTFLLLLPSTILMGMTLPVVIGAYEKDGPSGGKTAGLLYGANTLGAVTGTLAAGLWLVPIFGLKGTCFWAGGADFAIGAAALFLHQNEGAVGNPALSPDKPRTHERPRTPRTPWLGKGVEIRVAYGLAGAAALGLELCWFRLMSQLIGPTAHAISITLAVFLLGIALGSLLASPWVGRFLAPIRALGLLLFITCALALLPLFYLDDLPALYQSLWIRDGEKGTPNALLLTQGIEACALILPATLSMGATFPFAVGALVSQLKRTQDSAVIAAELFYINTFGAVAGTIFWGFVLIPALGVHNAVRAGAATCFIAGGLVLLWKARLPKKDPQSFAVLAGALTVFSLFLWLRAPEADQKIMNLGIHSSVRSNRSETEVERRVSKTAELLFVKDGLNGTVAVMKNRYGRGELDLAVSGKWVATTEASSRPHLHHLAHIPMLLARAEPRTALVIGMGSGITTGALLCYPELERVDVIELEPAVAEATSWFKDFNHDPLSDPRTHLSLQDGRTFVAYGPRKYEVITSDPIHPWVKGAGNLYTLEYYQYAARRLAPGGIFAQWIPSSMSRRSFAAIVRTMKRAFPELKLHFSGYEIVALGSLEPIEAKREVFLSRSSPPRVSEDLRAIHTDPEKFFTKVQTGLKAATVSTNGQLNTDDNVFLEHRLPWDFFFDRNFVLEEQKARRKH